ncbi:MAG TPA: hypothetical protein VLC10_00590 [Patescibacteria group bacterium]|nr:hypothetical protein [Patescibacteria group bacterium]
MSVKKSALTSEQRARIERFIALTKQKGISVELNAEETKVVLKGRDGRVLGSRPVGDFADR